MSAAKSSDRVVDLSWSLKVTLTRRQVISMGKLAELVGNIETMAAEFPDIAGDIGWDEVRGAFHEFQRASKMDRKFYEDLHGILNE